MYIAALRIADDFGCDAIGIQYQQGLKDLVPASDLAEGLLNNVDRPPVRSRDGQRELYAGQPLPHFNEVDECVGRRRAGHQPRLDGDGPDPATTLHDVRWGEPVRRRLRVGLRDLRLRAAVALDGGYAGRTASASRRCTSPSAAARCAACSKPGRDRVVAACTSRTARLHVDLGRGHVVELPAEETERPLDATTPQWPIMHAVLYGVGRDQMMAQHKANHVQVVYAPDADTADRALHAKAALFDALGLPVNFCGRSTWSPPDAGPIRSTSAATATATARQPPRRSTGRPADLRAWGHRW